MKQINIVVSAHVYENIDELPAEDRRIMDAAIKATETSYSPYSNFKVGATLLMEDDSMVTASNQENAAYPSGMCAERIAIWKAATSFPGKKIKKIAITANSPNNIVNMPIGPCGACRQVLLEYETNQDLPIEVIFMGEIGEVIKVESMKALMPFSFDGSFL